MSYVHLIQGQGRFASVLSLFVYFVSFLQMHHLLNHLVSRLTYIIVMKQKQEFLSESIQRSLTYTLSCQAYEPENNFSQVTYHNKSNVS